MPNHQSFIFPWFADNDHSYKISLELINWSMPVNLDIRKVSYSNWKINVIWND